MGKKKVMEPVQQSQEEVAKPARKKGTSTKPKEAKKPVVKISSPKATASTKAKTTATTPDDVQVKSADKAKVKSKKDTQPTVAPAAKGESPKQKVKELKKQWQGADDKVNELKKAYKKLKKKEGKAKAKESMSPTLKTAKAERKTLKQAVKSAKKIRA